MRATGGCLVASYQLWLIIALLEGWLWLVMKAK